MPIVPFSARGARPDLIRSGADEQKDLNQKESSTDKACQNKTSSITRISNSNNNLSIDR
jgi:hypothetical protein